jgi:ADP-glucose pyrophosphorylase
MKIDDTGRVISFSEKPKGADLKAMVSCIGFFMQLTSPV